MLKDLLKRMEVVTEEAKKADRNTKEGMEKIRRSELYSKRAREAFSTGSVLEACDFLMNELKAYYNAGMEEKDGKVKFYADCDVTVREIGVAISELMKNPSNFKWLDEE